MDLRRSLPSAALATALTPAVLLTPSTAWAASSSAPLANQAGPARAALGSPASWPVYCAGSLPALVPPLDRGTLFNPDDHSDLLLGTPGLPAVTVNGAPIPSAIAAGSGWHDFQMTASLPLQSPNSNLTDSPRDMKWIVFVSNGPEKGNPNDLLVSHVQYLNGSVWSDLGLWAGASTKLVTTTFDIDNSSQTATASLRLRFKIDAGAPPGPAYVVEFGSYVDAEQACTHFTFDANMITVRAPGSAPGSSRLLQYADAGVVVIVAGSAIVLVARRRKRS
jgi:hypothetical protein